MLKLETKKFLVSFLITTIALSLNTLGFDFSKIIDSLKNVFLDFNWSTFSIALTLYLFGYIIFNLVYFITKAILKNKARNISLLTITSLIILSIVILFALNDKLIYEDINSYDLMSYYYVPQNSNGIKIDSTNFSKYVWSRETFIGDNSLVKEKIVFKKSNSFDIIGSRITVDKLYFFRKLFNIINKYDINVQYDYGNSIHIVDSLNNRYTIQIRNNKLYLNTMF